MARDKNRAGEHWRIVQTAVVVEVQTLFESYRAHKYCCLDCAAVGTRRHLRTIPCAGAERRALARFAVSGGEATVRLLGRQMAAFAAVADIGFQGCSLVSAVGAPLECDARVELAVTACNHDPLVGFRILATVASVAPSAHEGVDCRLRFDAVDFPRVRTAIAGLQQITEAAASCS